MNNPQNSLFLAGTQPSLSGILADSETSHFEAFLPSPSELLTLPLETLLGFFCFVQGADTM